MRHPRILALAVPVLIAGLARTASGAEPEPLPAQVDLRFGVYTSDKPSVMYRTFLPIIEYLEKALEQDVQRPVGIELTIFRTYDEGIDALADGSVDFVRFGPASYITAKDQNRDVELIAMEHDDGHKRFKGVILVRADSPIKTLADLRRRSFAFGDPNSTIGRYLSQALLVEAGVHAHELLKFEYLGRHDTVAKAVEVGDFDAGAVKESTWLKVKGGGRIRVLAEFDNVTKPWIARAGLHARVVESLQKGLIGLTDPAVLSGLKVSGFMKTSDEEYDFVRKGMKQAESFESR